MSPLICRRKTKDSPFFRTHKLLQLLPKRSTAEMASQTSPIPPEIHIKLVTSLWTYMSFSRPFIIGTIKGTPSSSTTQLLNQSGAETVAHILQGPQHPQTTKTSVRSQPTNWNSTKGPTKRSLPDPPPPTIIMSNLANPNSNHFSRSLNRWTGGTKVTPNIVSTISRISSLIKSFHCHQTVGSGVSASATPQPTTCYNTTPARVVVGSSPSQKVSAPTNNSIKTYRHKTDPTT